MIFNKKPLNETSVGVFVRWLVISVAIGLAAGSVGILFHYTLEWCTEVRQQHSRIILLLPLAGILIAWLYKRFAKGDRGTNMVLSAIRSDENIRAVTAPLIFIGTALTHLFGGSAGREGAALQLGSSIATQVGALFRPDEKDRRMIVMCGTSAAFAALFGTPVTAAVFSMEVVSVGVMYYSAIVPCTVAAVTGSLLARFCGISPTAFVLSDIPAVELSSLLRVLVLGMLCAGVSIMFCTAMHKTGRLMKKALPNVYLRSFTGGAIIILLTLLLGTTDYNGAGMDVIARAVGGSAEPWDFLLKMLFTAITLGTGYKGGEIVPVFFTGATFGCVAGGALGLGSSFGAGIGLAAVFCGVTNCPITSLLLSIELFGSQGLLLFATAIAATYMLSGYSGLYGEQKIVYSKLKAEFIDVKAK